MRREKKQQNKTMLIADTMKYISAGHKMCETMEYAIRLCKFYFPNADDCFIETYRILVNSLQNKYWFENEFDFVLRQYK